MRLTTTSALVSSLTVLGLASQSASAFAPPHQHLTVRGSSRSNKYVALFQSAEDCGCTTFSGKPSEKALTIDPRESIGSNPIYTVNGEQTSINEQIGTTGSSVVVFLRSLG
mmetsp:Transcript_31870/g.52553  ORF Transcript_31870/g.52553 Transcript_31870/m.52553 type:complete len:111 (+) Transcript_31870:126-458(+)